MATPQKQLSTPSEVTVRPHPHSSVEPTNTHQSPGLNTSTDSSAELAAVVDDLLNQLNTKFTTVSSDLLSKSKSIIYCTHFVYSAADSLQVDDMSRRLDNLEAQIQAGEGKGSSAGK